MSDLLKVADVAKQLKINEKTVRLLVKKGELTCIRVGSLFRFRQEDLEAYIVRAALGVEDEHNNGVAR